MWCNGGICGFTALQGQASAGCVEVGQSQHLTTSLSSSSHSSNSEYTVTTPADPSCSLLPLLPSHGTPCYIRLFSSVRSHSSPRSHPSRAHKTFPKVPSSVFHSSARRIFACLSIPFHTVTLRPPTVTLYHPSRPTMPCEPLHQRISEPRC